MTSSNGTVDLMRLYEQWRAQWPLSGMSLWSSALHLLKTEGAPWASALDRHGRLVVIANHPYGLLGRVAICALAERLGRPFKVLPHSQPLRVPEAMPCFLPIEFNETGAAARNNIEARRRAGRQSDPVD